MTSIAFITTSKGRLHHLQETLPLLLADGAAEVIVVDYGCPDGTGAWVEQSYPAVRVVRVTDDPGFCLPRARNIGARQSNADWLVFIDADVKVSPGWIDWMRQNLKAGQFFLAGRIDGARDPETWGTVICSRADFTIVGGYDEAFRGWGGEDADYYLRLAQSGVTRSEYPGHFVRAIKHGDDQRTTWSDIKDRRVNLIVSRCYVAAKLQLIAFNGRRVPLDLATRVNLMEQTKQRIAAWGCDDTKPPPVLKYRFTGRARLPSPYVMSKQFEFTIRIDHRDIRPTPPGEPLDDSDPGKHPLEDGPALRES